MIRSRSARRDIKIVVATSIAIEKGGTVGGEYSVRQVGASRRERSIFTYLTRTLDLDV